MCSEIRSHGEVGVKPGGSNMVLDRRPKLLSFQFDFKSPIRTNIPGSRRDMVSPIAPAVGIVVVAAVSKQGPRVQLSDGSAFLGSGNLHTYLYFGSRYLSV